MNFPQYLPRKVANSCFVKRDKELDKIRELFSASNQHATVGICGIPGTGKSVLALQYALDVNAHARWFNADLFHIEYKEFANELLGQHAVENKTLDSIIETVNARLKLFETQILLIIDNLDAFEHLDAYTSGLTDTNVNLLVTSQNCNIAIPKLRLESFEVDQASTFLTDYTNIYLPALRNEETISQVVNRGEKRNELTPLKLRNVIHFVKEFSLNVLQLENMYEYLEARAGPTFCFLQYCSLLNSGYIPVSFLVELFKTSSSVINLKQTINQLQRLALIETFHSELGINAIRLSQSTQQDVLVYRNNATFLAEIAKCLNSLFANVGENRFNWKFNRNYYVQTSHICKNVNFSGIDDKLTLCDLMRKLASYELHVNSNLSKSLEYNLACFELQKEYGNDQNLALQIADTMRKIANTYALLGDFGKSLEYEWKCYEIRKRLLESTDNCELQVFIVDSLINLAEFYEKVGDLEKSLEFSMKCLKVQALLSEKDHMRIADNLTTIALSYSRLGEYSRALEYKLHAYEVRKKFDLEPDIVANSLYSIGVSYESMGEHDKSLAYYLESYELRQRIFSDSDHSLMADSLFSLANAYSYVGEYSKSLDYDLKCLQMRRNIYGSKNALVADSLYNIAVTYRKMGDLARSLDFFVDCYKLKEKLLHAEDPESHPDLVRLNKVIQHLKKKSK